MRDPVRVAGLAASTLREDGYQAHIDFVGERGKSEDVGFYDICNWVSE